MSDNTQYYALIFGPNDFNNNVTIGPKKFPQGENKEVLAIMQGTNLEIDEDTANFLEGQLEKLVWDYEFIKGEETASISQHFNEQDCVKLIRNLYSVNFVNEFTKGDLRPFIARAVEAQNARIEKAMNEVKNLVVAGS